MGKPTICICENKDADQLRGNREADQRLCFRYSDSTIPLLLKSEISSFWLFSVTVQVGLCRTCSETTLLVFARGCPYVASQSPPDHRYSPQAIKLLSCSSQLSMNFPLLVNVKVTIILTFISMRNCWLW